MHGGEHVDRVEGQMGTLQRWMRIARAATEHALGALYRMHGWVDLPWLRATRATRISAWHAGTTTFRHHLGTYLIVGNMHGFP